MTFRIKMLRRKSRLAHKKKSQASATQIFVYVFSAIIAALVLLYGYSVIKKLGKENVEIQKMELKVDLQNAVKEIAPDYGSVRRLHVRVPSGFTKVCFVSTKCIKPGSSCAEVSSRLSALASQGDKYPIIKDSIESGIGKNLFLYPDGTDSYDIGNIEVWDVNNKAHIGFECYTQVNGFVDIYLEGRGKLARVYGAD